MKDIPPLPPKPTSEPPRGSWLAILLALGGASIVAAVLSLVTLFYLLPVFAIAAVIFFVAAFHYFVWGWWIRGYLEQAREEEELPPND